MNATTSPAARLLPGLAAVVALALSGCGGKGEVSGTVRFNGKPLSAGRVTFQRADRPGAVVSSAILDDGTYRVSDCPTGPVRVTVQAVVPRSGRPRPGAAGRADKPALPVRYADPTTSGLDYTVSRGPQEFDIDLKP